MMESTHNTFSWTPERVSFMADALRYLRAYEPHPEEISPDAVLPQLRPLPNHPDFRLYLPRKREIGLITFETSNIQEVFA